MLSRWLTKPGRLWGAHDLFVDRDAPPCGPGLYGWYLRGLPASVPLDGMPCFDGFSLAYVGISPSAVPKPGTNGQTLRSRLRMHFRGNASGSTLRLTLGCLLTSTGVLAVRLGPTGSTGRLTFGAGEVDLSRWISENARVTWLPHAQPWTVERQVIESLQPPLNLKDNGGNPFAGRLHQIRLDARRAALSLRREAPS